MPSFELIEPVVRRLQPDEEYVVIEFERHASRCPDCIDPLKTFDMGRGLCDRGNQYAVDVNKYIYSLNFKAHSSVDRDCQQPTLLQLSLDCICVHRLLLAIEYGLQLRPKREDIRIQERTPSPVRPVISYDRTYHVAPRMPSASPPSYGQEIVERVSHNNKSRRVIVYPSSSSRSSSSTRESRSSRGSLYVEDFAARVDRVRESPRSSGPIEYHRWCDTLFHLFWILIPPYVVLISPTRAPHGHVPLASQSTWGKQKRKKISLQPTGLRPPSHRDNPKSYMFRKIPWFPHSERPRDKQNSSSARKMTNQHANDHFAFPFVFFYVLWTFTNCTRELLQGVWGKDLFFFFFLLKRKIKKEKERKKRPNRSPQMVMDPGALQQTTARPMAVHPESTIMRLIAWLIHAGRLLALSNVVCVWQCV